MKEHPGSAIKPRCIVVAGPNGAGKTTSDAESFAFETTLSGLSYHARLARWKARGYRIEMTYLRVDSTGIALKRIAARVKQDGHDVPRADVLRRFDRSWLNFERLYRPLADAWSVYDNSGVEPVLLDQGP